MANKMIREEISLGHRKISLDACLKNLMWELFDLLSNKRGPFPYQTHFLLNKGQL